MFYKQRNTFTFGWKVLIAKMWFHQYLNLVRKNFINMAVLHFYCMIPYCYLLTWTSNCSRPGGGRSVCNRQLLTDSDHLLLPESWDGNRGILQLEVMWLLTLWASLYAGTNVDGVADVVVMPDGVLTVSGGLELGFADGPWVGPGVEEEPLIELGADSVAVNPLAPGPNLDAHSEPI